MSEGAALSSPTEVVLLAVPSAPVPELVVVVALLAVDVARNAEEVEVLIVFDACRPKAPRASLLPVREPAEMHRLA